MEAMRALLAIVLSSLCLWAQVPAGFARLASQAAHACACCQGPNCTCCFGQPASDPVPLSAATLNLAGGRLAPPDLWTAAAAPAEPPLTQCPALQTGRDAEALWPVPAYRRHCALRR